MDKNSPKAKEHILLEILRHEFSSRAQKNPQYSLRAFSRTLGISHSLLSMVMSGKRPPSRKLILDLSERLPLDAKQRQALLSSLIKKGRALKKKNVVYQRLDLDAFSVVSEWQHYAILSLLEISDSELTPDFISERLNISVGLARVSLQKLFKLNLIEKDSKSNRWRQSTAPIVIENTQSTAHTRQFQRQLMEKAIESMEMDPMEIRDLSSTTFAMDPKYVGYALKRIREFRRELTKELEDFGAPKEVYNLSVQIFPTSRRRKK